MVNFTLKHCAYFIAVAEHGGIAQAARVLNMSQPAIAQAIDKLEDLYGLPLFDRHHALGMDLTHQGRSVLPKFKDLVRQAERVERDLVSIASGKSGTLRFGCFHTLAPFYLSRILRAQFETRPGVEIVPSEHSQDEIVSGLKSGDLDLALTYQMSLDKTDLDWYELDRLTPFVILRSDHPLVNNSSIWLADLAEEPFVMFDGPGSTDYFENTLAEAGHAARVAYSSRSMEAVRCAVGNGIGYSLSVMRPKVGETYDGGRVVYLPVRDDVRPLPIVLTFKKGRGRSGLIEDIARICTSDLTDAQAPAVARDLDAKGR